MEGTWAQATMLDGMSKVASIIETNPGYDAILGERLIREEYDSLSTDASGKANNAEQLITLFNGRLRKARPSVYVIPAESLGAKYYTFASTSNNRREIDFLASLLRRNSIEAPLTNLCDLERARSIDTDSSLKDALAGAFESLVKARDVITKGLLHQLIAYSSFALGAAKTLESSVGDVFVVANDHSPGPVAYTKVAESIGMKSVYLQHAEVTANFPRLDFDLSILRNRASLATYAGGGPPTGDVVIASRDPASISLSSIEVSQNELRESSGLAAYIYPSGVSSQDGVRRLYGALSRNPAISSVAVKVHPSTKNIDDLYALGMRVQRETPTEPHLAICGNSSVVIELVASGNLVFQSFEIDSIEHDYYGFVRDGITSELKFADAEERFWNSGTTHLANSKLVDFLPNLRSAQNLAEAVRIPRALRQIFSKATLTQQAMIGSMKAESLLRDVYSYPHSLIAQVRSSEDFYGDDFWVIRTLEQAFARREPELNGAFTAVDLNLVNSAAEFWLASKAVEWTGRTPTNAELDHLARFVRLYDTNSKAKEWMENKLFDLLIRFGQPPALLALFHFATSITPARLSANKKVALDRYVKDSPSHKDSLLQLTGGDSIASSPLERLKISVQNLRTIDGNLEYSDFRVVEDRFVELSPALALEYDKHVRSPYRKLGGRASYIDVQRNELQRQALGDVIRAHLRERCGYSFIRLSDGEGIIFKDYSDFFSLEDSENRQRHWWGETVPPRILNHLISDLQAAVLDADLVGIPSIYRFLRDHSDRSRSLAQNLQGRGLLAVLQGLSEFDSARKRYTDDKANLVLFSRIELVAELACEARNVVVVSSGATGTVRRAFAELGPVTHIQVPTHFKTRTNQKYFSAGRPLPYQYEGINREIADKVHPGDLVLVGAGVAGKTFVHTSKKQGAVSLDIGSAMDQLLHAGIHSLF